MMEITFEKIIKSHLKEVKDILNYYISNSTAAYREDKIDIGERSKRSSSLGWVV